MVGLLLILNIIVLSFLAFRKPPRPGLHPQNHPMEKDLLENLELSEEQQNAFEKSKDNYIQKSKLLNEDLNNTSIKYYSASIDDSTRVVIHNDILDLTDKIYQTNLEHFDDLRSLCTPRQIEKMEEFINTLIKRRNVRPPRRKRR